MKKQTCTLFGHRECPETVKPILRAVLEELITVQGVTMFYVGHQGQFDRYARGILRQLKARYPHMEYAVVLAYLPTERREYDDHSDTMLPEGIEHVHPRFALDWRNRWMLDRADLLVTHVVHDWGGAAKYAEAARKRGKPVINIDGKSYAPFSTPVLEQMLRNDCDGTAPLPLETIFEICEILAQRRTEEAPAEMERSKRECWERLRKKFPELPPLRGI